MSILVSSFASASYSFIKDLYNNYVITIRKIVKLFQCTRMLPTLLVTSGKLHIRYLCSSLSDCLHC